MNFTVVQMIAATLLIVALADHPYDYYTILRFVVCPVAAYGAMRAHRFSQVKWSWTFGIVAVLFNPIFVVHLQRSTWRCIDAAVAVLFVVAIFVVRSSSKSPKE